MGDGESRAKQYVSPYRQARVQARVFNKTSAMPACVCYMHIRTIVYIYDISI